ncbi:hypothetical protein DOTSEDRAFT_33074 [Dothistroma septosporum NZE10]|uniref:Uncharacterized protein n=1 Tax=Dothistroma septosporum (strain NZE10 / CBS 128990) TaxID=675120 RepID=N1PVN7_DOTSN|nr:hypothetical protein DOTSEDRAFT_33074 [Dothistroma septosporum NZE10]
MNLYQHSPSSSRAQLSISPLVAIDIKSPALIVTNTGLLRIPTKIQHMTAEITGRTGSYAASNDLQQASSPYHASFAVYLITISKDTRATSRLKVVEFVILDLEYVASPSSYGRQQTEEQLRRSEQQDSALRAVKDLKHARNVISYSKAVTVLLNTTPATWVAASVVPILGVDSKPTWPAVVFGLRELAAILESRVSYTTGIGQETILHPISNVTASPLWRQILFQSSSLTNRLIWTSGFGSTAFNPGWAAPQSGKLDLMEFESYQGYLDHGANQRTRRFEIPWTYDERQPKSGYCQKSLFDLAQDIVVEHDY